MYVKKNCLNYQDCAFLVSVLADDGDESVGHLQLCISMKV